MDDLPPELVEIFERSLERKLGLLDEAIAERDLKQLSFQAHALRGTAASYGYESLGREAGAVEEAADAGQWEAAAAAYGLFRASAREVLASLQSGAQREE